MFTEYPLEVQEDWKMESTCEYIIAYRWLFMDKVIFRNGIKGFLAHGDWNQIPDVDQGK